MIILLLACDGGSRLVDVCKSDMNVNTMLQNHTRGEKYSRGLNHSKFINYCDELTPHKIKQLEEIEVKCCIP